MSTAKRISPRARSNGEPLAPLSAWSGRCPFEKEMAAFEVQLTPSQIETYRAVVAEKKRTGILYELSEPRTTTRASRV